MAGCAGIWDTATSPTTRFRAEFFGCAGVAEVENLQDVLLHVMRTGHRHHVNLTPGTYAQPLKEALNYYLGHDVTLPQWEADRPC